MSLAPTERRALARIEESLRRSDPRLASMLTRFRLPLVGGGWISLTRGLRRVRPFVAPTTAVIAAIVFIVAIAFSAAVRPPCGVRSAPAPAAGGVRASDCLAGIHAGHAGGTVGHGPTTGLPGSQGAP